MRTNLITHILPAIESVFPFQVGNLTLIFSIIGFQNSTLLGFPPIDILKYLNGKTIQPLLRQLENTTKSTSLNAIAPTWLLWKLTFNLETISKLRSIALTVKTHCRRGWQKNKVSSANCSNLTSTFFNPTPTPSNIPILDAFLTNPASP